MVVHMHRANVAHWWLIHKILVVYNLIFSWENVIVYCMLCDSSMSCVLYLLFFLCLLYYDIWLNDNDMIFCFTAFSIFSFVCFLCLCCVFDNLLYWFYLLFYFKKQTLLSVQILLLPHGCEWANVSSGTGSPRVVPDKGPLNGCVCVCLFQKLCICIC